MATHIGRRTLPATIDAIAHAEPRRPWGSVIRADLTGVDDISFGSFANAINRTARWIVDTVGAAPDGVFPTIAYLGPSDLRYYVMLIASVKAGYKPMFFSHRNSQAANSALLKATDCHIVLNAFVDVDPHFIDDNIKSVTHFRVPSAKELWDSAPVELFPFAKSYKQAANDPLLVLHTSGSSGLPKPVTYTHAVMASADLRQTIRAPAGSDAKSEIETRSKTKRSLFGFPPFHAAGLLSGLQDTVWYNLVIVFPPAHKPLDGPSFRDMLPVSGAHGAYLLPNVLEQLGRMPDALAVMDKYLDYLVWVGGPISSEAGEALSRVTMVIQSYASTEIGSINTLTPKLPEDWNYHWFTPNGNGFDFRPVAARNGTNSERQLYELFVVRDPSLLQQVFCIFPELDEWPTNDLFSKHPVRLHLWRHEGRSDDLIVMGNGGNLMPRPIEMALRTHPAVRDALVVGARRPRPAVILEPVDPVQVDKRQSFLDSIMPTVVESNVAAPVNGQLERELLLVAAPDRPLPRTGKGTIQRGAAFKLYEEDLDALYAALPAHLQKARVERVQGTSV